MYVLKSREYMICMYVQQQINSIHANLNNWPPLVIMIVNIVNVLSLWITFLSFFFFLSSSPTT